MRIDPTLAAGGEGGEQLRPDVMTVTLHARGGAGYGITTTQTSDSTYLTGPPDSSITADRSNPNHPTIAGSTGGFIGLVSGLAIFLVIAALAGFFLYNRYRQRQLRTPLAKSDSGVDTASGFPSLKSRFGKGRVPPPLHVSAPTDDPYADPGSGRSQAEDQFTPRAHKFRIPPFGVKDDARPGYMRQRSEEWEVPSESSPTAPMSAGMSSRSSRSGGGGLSPNTQEGSDPLGANPGGKGKGKGKEREWVQVDMPTEPGSAAYPLRSRSPIPLGNGSQKGRSNAPGTDRREADPFADTFASPATSPEIELAPLESERR